jgi:hypothetical protein
MFIPLIDDEDDMFPLFVLPHAAARSTTDTTATGFIIFIMCKILLFTRSRGAKRGPFPAACAVRVG